MENKLLTSRARRLLAPVLAVYSLAVGCTEDVGECFQGDGKNGARDTVVYAGQVQFGGQAIMNKACAGGTCHTSTATGLSRNGAPAGLDFDLVPLTGGTPATDGEGRSVLAFEPAELSGLRERRIKIYNERHRIWQQVRDGLMPPDGLFAQFKLLMRISDSDEKSPCTAGAAYDSIDSKGAQDVLRNWLACRAPIVEARGDVEANGVGGATGFQYLSCGDEPDGDGGMSSEITLDDVYTQVFEGDGFCAGCHPGSARNYPIDLTSVETAYTTLLDDEERCNGKPYVTPGDLDKSFLLDVLTMDEPGCMVDRMPKGFADPLPDEQIEMVRQWIMQGAKRASDKRLPPLGLDAGAR